MISWPNFSEKVIDDFKNNGYTFNQIAEMKIITIANKLDMSDDFYIKHNIDAFEWRLNALVSENKKLVNKLDCSKCHLLIRKNFLMSYVTIKYSISYNQSYSNINYHYTRMINLSYFYLPLINIE